MFTFYLISRCFYIYKNFIPNKKKQTTEESKLNIKNIIGPASISLGAMIVMDSIIGVIGVLSKYSTSGEVNVEAIAILALIGSWIMVPVSYCWNFKFKNNE